ncbi:MAG: hypothetical protein HYZ36_04345 [Pedosphaera parvula]|nr:hypothetical protein [Pedosphaera parvula]
MLCALGVAMSAPAVSSHAADLSAEFFVHEFSLTLDAGSRQEILGPLFSFETNGTRLEQRWTPVFSRTIDPGTDSEEIDFVYPVLTYDRFGTQYRLQLLQLLSFAGGESQDNVDVRRFSLFPFYFQQRSTDTNRDYTAFIPFYGHLKGRFFRDEVKFVMLPLYAQSRKKDVITDNYLYPFFHLRHGDGLRGWQVWPLVGREHKEITTRLDRFGDPEEVPGHDKFFVLWPFYFNNHLDIGTKNPQRQQILLPFYSLSRSPQRDSSSYLWPLFSYTEDREKKYTEWGAPWPLVVFTRGEGKSGNRVWPLFSKFHTPTQESSFYLWPLYKHTHAHAPPLDRDRTRILFFLYSDLVEKHTVTGETKRRRDLWPLFTQRRDLNGNERLQVLAPLEPLLPGSKSIERDYSPIWSLWRAERNAKTGAASQSLLWNLYRNDTTTTTRKCSLLFGLFQYESTPEGKRSRWFYLPVRRAIQSSAAKSEPESNNRQR